MNIKLKPTLLIPIICALFSCGGGGGSSDSGMVIEGTLTEAGGAIHDTTLNLRHSAGQKIETVMVCALGECSETDGQGQWGFLIDSGFNGGEVEFSFDGHGITTKSIISVPAAQNVSIDFAHVAGGKVVAQHITADGQTEHLEDETHEAGGDHSDHDDTDSEDLAHE